MKKTGMVLLSFFIFLFSGCSAQTPPALQLDFTASVLIRQEDSLSQRQSYQAQLISTTNGLISLRIKSTDALNNLTYKWDDKLTLSSNDMYLQTETDYLPSFSFAQAIYNVLTDLPTSGEFAEFADNEAVFCGLCKSGEYTVKTDKNGYIQNISIEELKLSVDFDYDL